MTEFQEFSLIKEVIDGKKGQHISPKVVISRNKKFTRIYKSSVHRKAGASKQSFDEHLLSKGKEKVYSSYSKDSLDQSEFKIRVGHKKSSVHQQTEMTPEMSIETPSTKTNLKTRLAVQNPTLNFGEQSSNPKTRISYRKKKRKSILKVDTFENA